MGVFFTLLRRELAAYLVTWIGYILIAASALLTGGSFVVILTKLRMQPSPAPVTELFFSTQFFWLILLPMAPLLTMRLFALEKFTGTFETLMTSAVSEAAVVLAKFTAALVFYLLLWTPLAVSLALAHRFTGGGPSLAGGTLAGTLLGVLLLGALFIAVGCCASALTRSQIVAAMVSTAGGMGLFLLSFVGSGTGGGTGWPGQLLACAALGDFMAEFARGLVDTRPVVFCLSLTVFFLFLTLRVVESRRWK